MRAIVVAALVMVAAALLEPAAAQAARPCWQRVLGDWRDGRVDGEYPVHCYRDALSHLPEDLRVYGTAEADIQRALTRELAERPAQTPARAPARSTTRHLAATSTVARSSQQRKLAAHGSAPAKAKRAKPPRAAASPAAPPGRSSFPVTLLLVFGGVAVATAVALASWRRAAAVRRSRQEI